MCHPHTRKRLAYLCTVKQSRIIKHSSGVYDLVREQMKVFRNVDIAIVQRQIKCNEVFVLLVVVWVSHIS